MAKTYLNDIINIEPSSISEDKWQNLYDRMDESGWYGREGQRVGFIKVAHHNGLIGGFFANEGRKKAIQYDNNKEQLEPPPYHSFEHLFFAIFKDTAQILLQSRYVYDYADLGLPEMRNNLLLLLTEFFRYSEIYVVGNILLLESAGVIYSQDELYSTYLALAQVSELEISNLYGASLPSRDDPRYKLYNPKDEWEPITWGAVADTLESGLDSVYMATSGAVDSTLQAPIPKALAAVGEIQTVRGHDSEGRIVYRRHTEEADLEIELPVSPEITPQLLKRIFEDYESRDRVKSWRERQKKRKGNKGQDMFEGLG